MENFAQGYQDYLQAPLQVSSFRYLLWGYTQFRISSQPLMDNLQSVTYQTFEQDPVKYTKYEEACEDCIRVNVSC